MTFGCQPECCFVDSVSVVFFISFLEDGRLFPFTINTNHINTSGNSDYLGNDL